jgi:hypothetical protein
VIWKNDGEGLILGIE